MRAINPTQSLPIGIKSDIEFKFTNTKIDLLYEERQQCKPKIPIPILPVSFIRKC